MHLRHIRAARLSHERRGGGSRRKHCGHLPFGHKVLVATFKVGADLFQQGVAHIDLLVEGDSMPATGSVLKR
jgi:hypothetical protein